MTVAAVILCPTIESALADTAGRPAVRRLTESAWAGGATPIVVISADAEARVATALAGSAAILAEPAPAEQGALGQVLHATRVAREHVAATDALLIWPARMAWVDAETVTSLIEAHGADPGSMLRPAYSGQPGLPVLVPLEHTAALEPVGPGEPADEVLLDIRTDGIPARTIEVGDPGVIHDRSTAIDELPEFEGPPEPVAGPPPEWGAAAAETPDESPPEGPTVVRYGQPAQKGG